MVNYLAQRILLLIPMLIVVSLLGFAVKHLTAQDPAERMKRKGIADQNQRPVFYFTISTYAFPDTLYRVTDPAEREALTALTYQHGNWAVISRYYQALCRLRQAQKALKPDSIGRMFYQPTAIREAFTASRFGIRDLLTAHRDPVISKQFKNLKALYGRYPFFESLRRPLQEARQAYIRVLSMPAVWKNYLPIVHWRGFENQYHQWLKGLVTQFDFGRSYRTGEPVLERLQPRLGWTIGLALLAVFLAYALSLPVGIYGAYFRNSKFDWFSGGLMFALAALPNFFVGALLLFLLANPDVLAWFPESGVKGAGQVQQTASWAQRVPYLVLPLLTYTYGQIAFLSRQMRAGMLEILPSEYIRMARAKGLPEWKVVFKHALKNAMLPVITLFASAFPLALGSSVIVEKIFAIPGIGWELYQAILRADYPVIVAIFTIVGLLMLVSFLLIDGLYALVDPRLSNRNRG